MPRRLLFVPVMLLAALALALAAIVEFPQQARPRLPPSIAILLPPALPAAKSYSSVHWLEQNWSDADRFWAHHASQGTATLPIPYAWFLALEQPGLSLFSQPGLLRDDAYLARIGFIPSPRSLDGGAGALRAYGFGGNEPPPPEAAPSTSLQWSAADNRDGLPVGFARAAIAVDPRDGSASPDRIGLTCAACHTGHIDYNGVSLRFDGGPAMVNFNALERAVSLSLFYTLKTPFRFDRFAARVLGPRADAQARSKLRADLSAAFDAIVASARATGAIEAAAGQASSPENFGRLDALNRIGNRLFFEDLGGPRGGGALAVNYHATDAPVRFPALWSVPWFAWAEYDASIEQPLVRNVGEALGVGALVNLGGGAKKDLFASSVKLENIVWMEDLLRGGDFFSSAQGGLRAPKWPAAFFPGDAAWAIDPARVARGRALYSELCAGCHLGPIADPAFDQKYPDRALKNSDAWRTGANGARTLDLRQIPVALVGTDPAQSEVLRSRMIEPPAIFGLDPQRDIAERWNCPQDLAGFSGKDLPFSLALMASVDRIARKWMDDHATPEDERAKIFGPRKSCPNPEAQAVYRARTLDGVWATAPYLHNGSVPSLYWLLRKASERPQQFCLGARDYDPREVGYRADPVCAEGETLFSTRDAAGRPIKGNSVAGHSFEAGGLRPGVVGRALSDGERADLIEYLKTL